ncbi:MAG: hypothetical protein JNJ75_09835 [Cyclobacteriaceae bacterium]|nr:hypothetical protein [Cyclobacteriaceae bacterium]
MKKVNLNSLVATGIILLSACQPVDNKSNNKLERQLDSVNQELAETRQELMDSQQVKALLDSIDASRQVTAAPMNGSSDAQNNISRLNDINEYVKDINLKMDQMERSIKYVNTMAASILALQADVNARSEKIARLEAEAKKLTTPTKANSLALQRKDSTLAAFIKSCQQDIEVLQKTMEEVHAKNNLATAEIYYKQAEVLAGIMKNMSSSAKRKFVQKEALEMYRISFSLGKKEARQKISAMEMLM